MHTSLLRTLAVASLIAVLAACSSVDAPTASDEELETTQVDIIGSGVEGPASDRPGLGGVCFYSLPNFQGRSLCYRAATRAAPVGTTLTVGGIRRSWNDRVSSIIVGRGWQVTTYTDANFRGRATVAGDINFDRTVPRLRRPNTLSSFRLTKESN